MFRHRFCLSLALDNLVGDHGINDFLHRLPADKNFLNDNLIYADKLVIFSTQKYFFATVIKSKEIADSYRTMFNLAWKNS